MQKTKTATNPGEKISAINNYVFYDANWKQNSETPVRPVTSINAKPGATWVSLSWSPPPGGLSGNEAGYVVCRSQVTSENVNTPPSLLAGPNIYIAYIGTKTYFGDAPLAENTAELTTADDGLLSETEYWYSVFVVTTLTPGSTSSFPEYLPGYISSPLSIKVKTLSIDQTNLIVDPTFLNVGGTTGWMLGSLTSVLTPNKLPAGASVATTNNPNASLDLINPNIENYLHMVMPQAGETSSLVIYQTISPNDPLPMKPGTLYSFSVWFRTNNPLSISAAANTTDQGYAPSFFVYGNNSVGSPETGYGAFQIESQIANEPSYGQTPSGESVPNPTACSTEDSQICKRTYSSVPGVISYHYSGMAGAWQKVSLTFITGGTKESSVRNAYNYTTNSNIDGDLVQQASQSLQSITIAIEIGAQEKGISIPGEIDIANATLVEGLIPYTDPFWNIQANDNLIYNPNFWGVPTPTLGVTVPGWSLPLTNSLFSDSEVCGAPCTGPCMIGNQLTDDTCLAVCAGGSGTCLGASGAGGCSASPKICPTNDGLCDTCNGGACTGSGDGSCTGTCKGSGRYACSGTCPETPCTGFCKGTCDNQCSNVLGTCGEKGGKCMGGTQTTQTCAGYTTCFNPSIYKDSAYQNTACTAPFGSDYSTYLLLQGCSCQNVSATQGNVYNPPLFYMGAYMLNPSVSSYTISFNYQVISVEGSNPTLGIYIYDETKGNVIFQETMPIIKGASDFSDLHTTQNFTAPFPFNPNVSFELNNTSATIAIRNFSLLATGQEIYGLQNPYPAIVTTPSVTQDTISNNAIVWRLPISSSANVQSQLYNETAQYLDGTKLGWPQGLVSFSGFPHTGASMDYMKIAQDSDPYLYSLPGFNTSGTNNVLSLSTQNFFLNTDGGIGGNMNALVMSNAYYGSGRWDLWVKYANLTKEDGTSYSPIVNPTGCCFAFWIFHDIDYTLVGGAKLNYEASGVRNTEIDIELNGDCPDYSQNYSQATGRLNGWGGQRGGSGGQFTMHTLMPISQGLDDGKYHKLTILFNSGSDIDPNNTDPNGPFPSTRGAGFIKWFVDDIEWGCGWTGNTYGFDNVPQTATRVVAGPWNPGWAGCGLCNETTCEPTTSNCYCNGCKNTTLCNAFPDYTQEGIPTPGCNLWQEATYYIAQMQFTPICIDCTYPENENYNYATQLPSRPNMENGAVIGASNRNRWLPETKPWLTFPTY